MVHFADGDRDDSLPAVARTSRLHAGSFSSGLTVPDFAACLQMGLRPVGLVQGFCAMSWAWYGSGAGAPYGFGMMPTGPTDGAYAETWRCPHGFVSGDHRAWGQNLEQRAMQDAWSTGFHSAFSRMVDEAKEVGAHGVVGIVDEARRLADAAVTEFHIMGTAVVLDGEEPPTSEPFTTYVAGQRLAKLIEAGYMPVQVVAAMVSVRIWASCVTQFLLEGGAYSWGAVGGREIEQVSRAQEVVRELARERARRQLEADSLFGVSIDVSEQERGEGDRVIDCTLRGTRVRRFSDPGRALRPMVTVGLA